MREREGESYRWPEERDHYSRYRVFIGTTRAEAKTRELIAVIRGSDGGRRMYGAGEALPGIYEERFRTQLYSERIDHPGVWNKAVVVAREDDDETILNHALIQGRRRFPR